MDEFLVLLLLQVTVFSSVTALILIAVKQIFKCRIPPKIGMMLWIVLLARLICPVFPESKVSVYNYVPVGKNVLVALSSNVNEEIEEKRKENSKAENPYVLQSTLLPDEYKALTELRKDPDSIVLTEEIPVLTQKDVAEGENTVYPVVIAAYFTGIIISLGFSIFSYQRAKKKALISSSLCEDEYLLAIYRKTALEMGIKEKKIPPLRCGMTSMLIGVSAPKVILRDDCTEKEASMVFAHELNHYKYRDNPLLVLSTIVSCLFWYNPLIWIVRRMLREDIEVLCDQRTLSDCGIRPTDYAMMLCRISAFGEIDSEAGCAMSAQGRKLKNRLVSISLNKKKKFLSKTASALLCAVIILVCLTNPLMSQNTEFVEYIENYADITGESERIMHMTEKVSVSEYLKEISLILSDNGYGCAELKNKLGNGSLESFKKKCAANENIDSELLREIKGFGSDTPLTNKTCAAISSAIMTILSGNDSLYERNVSLLPTLISTGDMENVLLNLDENEQAAVLACYNRGVKGANVRFDLFYTGAMMDLITDRINDSYARDKIKAFYKKIDTSSEGSAGFFNKIGINFKGDAVYSCCANITENEAKYLRSVIIAAYAGDDPDVYYLKKREDACSFTNAEKLFIKAGMTVDFLYEIYAKAGLFGDAFDSENFCAENLSFAQRRNADDVGVRGVMSNGIKKAVIKSYESGVLDTDENGLIDLGSRLSYGESLKSAFNLISSMIN